MILLALALITIHSDFEGGNIGPVARISDTHVRCSVAGQVDQDGRNRQANWYYFRVDGSAGREVTVDLVNLPGEYNYRPNRGAVTKDTLPVYSYDQVRWTHFESAEYDAETPRLRLRFTPRENRVWIAHVAPYTNRHLADLIKQAGRHPFFRQEAIGKTVEGRELVLLTVTDPSTREVDKKIIWLMFRQHAWESGSSWAGDGALRYLLSDKAADLRKQAIFKILPLSDPDGVARGGVRYNRHGYDLNRNWDVSDAKKMPEIDAQRRAVFRWLDDKHRIDAFLSVHNTETSEYVDGATNLAARFLEVLRAESTFNSTRPPQSMGASTDATKPGRMNVCQGLWRDRQVPCLLMEQMIAFNSKLGRLPTIEDRQQFGAALVRALFAAVR
jgi:murein tripeptide amidase MpaA